jgi:hypothetical protein
MFLPVATHTHPPGHRSAGKRKSDSKRNRFSNRILLLHPYSRKEMLDRQALPSNGGCRDLPPTLRPLSNWPISSDFQLGGAEICRFCRFFRQSRLQFTDQSV